MDNLYYYPPIQHHFDEVKEAAIKIWNSYEEPYSSKKIEAIEDIKNVGDNFMYMVAMFDLINQTKLSDMLSDGARKAISDRLIAGGSSYMYNPFL